MANCCTSELTNNIILEKNVDKSNVVVGDILTYSVAVINQGDLGITDAVIIDRLPTELEFVEGSVMVGTKNSENDNILSGVCIGSLTAGAMKVVTFKAKVVKRPNGGVISNTAFVKFQSMSIADCSTEAIEIVSNTVFVKVEIAEVKVVKKTDVSVVSREDVIPFTVTVTNVGTLEAKNILFTDILLEKDDLIEETFRVDGELVNIAEEIIPGVGRVARAFIGSIMPAEEIVITYEVKVRGISCKGYFVNKACVTFNYNLPGNICGEKTSELDEESISEIELGLSTFKQLSVDGYLTIPEAKLDIEAINSMTATATLVSSHVIKTPVSLSNEGQTLSGYKLIVKGMLEEVIEYTALDTKQSVHSAQYTVPFSTFIVLPADYVVGSRLEVDFIVEDIYYKNIDVRTLFSNVTLLVNVKVLCC